MCSMRPVNRGDAPSPPVPPWAGSYAVAVRRHGGVDGDLPDRLGAAGGTARHDLGGEELAHLQLGRLPAVGDLGLRGLEAAEALRLGRAGVVSCSRHKARQCSPQAGAEPSRAHPPRRASHWLTRWPSAQAASRSALRKAMLSATSGGSSESHLREKAACSTT